MLRLVKNNAISLPGTVPKYLTEDELNRLIGAYQKWFDERQNKKRARQWAIFLIMRFTGCRVSEAIMIDDTRDIDFRNSEVILNTLKRKRKSKRNVPLPANLVAEIARILATWPELRKNLFKLTRHAVFVTFKERAIEAGLNPELRHPHILRHTRAVELLRAGVPITAVQQLLGHADISTTAIYLQLSGLEIKQIMRDRGLI